MSGTLRLLYSYSRWKLEYVLAHEECQKVDEEFDAWCDGVIEAVKKLQEGM